MIADVLAARVFPTWLQYRLIVPAGLLTFVPLAGFAVSPGLELALGLLVVSGLGSAWMPGMDGLLVATAPPALRSRALALSQAGLMFTQGAGFALWGIAGQYAPLPVVIPLAAVAGCRGGHPVAATAWDRCGADQLSAVGSSLIKYPKCGGPGQCGGRPGRGFQRAAGRAGVLAAGARGGVRGLGRAGRR